MLISSCGNTHKHEGANHSHDGQEVTSEKADDALIESDNPKYDSDLARKLNADEYGMATYVIAFLKTGPNKSANKEEAEKMQAAHMANMNQLAKKGKLVMAGPFFDDPDYRGLFIFDVETIAEAEALTQTDPMIQNGILVMELKKWYGSAALREMNTIYHKIAKTVI